MQQIQLNIIPFSLSNTQQAFGFIKQKTEGYAALYKAEYPRELWQQHEDELKDISHLYCNFQDVENADYTATVDLTFSSNFANHYFRYLIHQYFIGKADIIFPNFVNDIEVWLHDSKKSTTQYKQYNKYTLKVQYARVTRQFELVVSYDGTSKIYTKSLQDLGSFDTDLLNWVNCNGTLYRYDEMLPEEKLDMDKIYPVISNRLKPVFGIPFDTPIFKNRYPDYHNLINSFYNTYLNNDAFRAIIPLAKEGFVTLPNEKVHRTKLNSNELLFGRQTANINPLEGMKKSGPYKPSPHNNVRFFFIYHPADKATSVAYLYRYFSKGFYKQNNEGQSYRAFPDLNFFIKQPLLLDTNSNIEISSYDTIVEEVETAIKNTPRDANTKYVAIYISPIAKTEENEDLHNVYYKVKEILVEHSISSQVIHKDNIMLKDFNFFLPNIEVALLAKIGGIPWRLNCPPSDELIVGVGAFYSHKIGMRYVGSAFCFNNEGIFKGFQCFEADETSLIAGSILDALDNFRKQKKEASRLIIHFYKKMSERDLEPITEALQKLKLDIPVIVITINKTESKELLAFDLQAKGKLMPESGTIIQVGRKEYLLFNNTKYSSTSMVKEKEYHFPVKLSVYSSKQEVFEDVATVKELIDQVYQFSRMYWKSISQQNLPVTTLYPEMVAEIYPHFNDPHLSDFGRNNLWFL